MTRKQVSLVVSFMWGQGVTLWLVLSYLLLLDVIRPSASVTDVIQMLPIGLLLYCFELH